MFYRRYFPPLMVLLTLNLSTGLRDSLLKEKELFSSFGKSAPGVERFCLESPLTFFFFKWGKLSKNKNPSLTLIRKKQSTKLDFWVRESGYLLGRFLMRGSTPKPGTRSLLMN